MKSFFSDTVIKLINLKHTKNNMYIQPGQDLQPKIGTRNYKHTRMSKGKKNTLVKKN